MEAQIVTRLVLESGQLIRAPDIAPGQTYFDWHIQHHHQVGREPARDECLDTREHASIDTTAIALVGHRRCRVAVADDDIAALQCREDDIWDQL